jgi:3-deoxy-D-manno-octulosonic-acid transferase
MRLRPVVLAASTHRGEEEQILAAFALLRQQFSDCLLVLVPRHPERFEEVNSLCASAGWQVVRRSAGINPQAEDDIVLGDTVGELLLLYGAATVAVVGGSLVDHGGHNVLEPAAWGVPVVTGPHMENFTAIADSLVAAGAMIRLDDTARLGACLVELLGQPERCRQMGSAGRQVVADNRGASQRLLALVQDLLVGR